MNEHTSRGPRLLTRRRVVTGAITLAGAAGLTGLGLAGCGRDETGPTEAADDAIPGLHHVGLVVSDMEAAIETYRRLGFTIPPPAYPMLPPAPGEPAQPVGAANTHIHLRGNFVEIATVIEDEAPIPDEAQLIPLEVPEDQLPDLLEAVRATAANLTTRLDLFEGLHILIVDSTDIDRAAARLEAAGVNHGGVHSVQRMVETTDGTTMAPARYLEINSEDPGAPPGLLPEGRAGVAENAPVDGEKEPEHANGATRLIGCLLCVPDDALTDTERRYQAYLGRTARADGDARTFYLDDGSVTLVAASALPQLLPEAQPPTLPAFVGYEIAVADIARTEDHLRAAGVVYTTPQTDEIVIPASEAAGCAVIFRTPPD